MLPAVEVIVDLLVHCQLHLVERDESLVHGNGAEALAEFAGDLVPFPSLLIFHIRHLQPVLQDTHRAALRECRSSMASGTTLGRRYAERPYAVVAGAAGLPVLHLGHADGLMVRAIRIDGVMAFLAA